MMPLKWSTTAAAVIFLLATVINPDTSGDNVIAAISVSFVFLVFLVALTCKRDLSWHTTSPTPRRDLIGFAFLELAGLVTVIISLLEYCSTWAPTLVFLGLAEAMALSNTRIFGVELGGLAIVALEMALYIMKYRDCGVAAVLGLCMLVQIHKHVNGGLGCKSICGFVWLMLKEMFVELEEMYYILVNKEEKEMLKSLKKTWEQDEIFREANPLHPMWQSYDDAFVRKHYPQWKWGNDS